MKKILSLILITALCFTAFSSCGNTEITPQQSNDKSTSSTTSQTTTTENVISPDIPRFDSVFEAIFGSVIITPLDVIPKLSESSEYTGWFYSAGYNTPFQTKHIPIPNNKDQTEEKNSNIDYTEDAYPLEIIEFVAAGKKYTLYPYQNNTTHFVYNDAINKLYCYISKDNLQYVQFKFNTSAFKNEDSNPNLQNCEAEVLKLAKEYASKFINTAEYTLSYSVKKNIYQTGNTDLYTIEYTKQFKGFDTTDAVHIEITSKGTLVAFSINNIGLFDNLPQDLDVSAAESFALEKLSEYFLGLKFSDTTVLDIPNYQFKTRRLGVNSEGNLNLIISIEADLTINDPDSKTGLDKIKSQKGFGVIEVYL